MLPSGSGSRRWVEVPLTLDQGTEMARHAQVKLATDLSVYFTHLHLPRERPSNENTNGLIREYLPKGIEITSHQTYLDSIADELNDAPCRPGIPHTTRSLHQATQRQCRYDGLTPPGQVPPRPKAFIGSQLFLNRFRPYCHNRS